MTYDGHPGNVSRRIRYVIRRAHKAGLIVTATTDGTHARGSWHYIVRGRNRRGRGVDLGLPSREVGTEYGQRKLEAFQRAEYKRARRLGFRTWLEIIGPVNGLVVLAGRPAGLTEGTVLEQAHDNHVHVAR